MPRLNVTRGGWFALYLAVAVALAGLVVFAYQSFSDARAVDRDRIDALSAGLREANRQLEELGQPTPPAPEQIVDEPRVVDTTTTTVVPPPPPTVPQAAIAAAVDRHLRANPPADGRPPTTEEIISAVVAVCTATGGCDGRDGRDAPAPTAAQIQAAVAAYCADGRCRGPRGEDGAAGGNGQPGAQGAVGPQGPPGPIVPCGELDPALGYACAPAVTVPTIPPPP